MRQCAKVYLQLKSRYRIGRNKTLSINRECELLQQPRSSYYRPRSSLTEWPVNVELMRLIYEEFLRHPFYASRKMKVYLSRKGISVNRKRIQRLMRLVGLEPVAPNIVNVLISQI